MAREAIGFTFNLEAWRRIIGRGSGYLLNSLLNIANTDSAKWIVGRTFTPADLGILTRATQLTGYPAAIFSAAVERVLFPAVARVQDEGDRLRKGALEAVQLVAVVGAPLAVAMMLLSEDLVAGFLGPSWIDVIPLFKVLCAAIYLRLADRLNWIILRGTGRPYRLAGLQGATFVLTVVSCVLAAPFGLTAIAVALVLVATATYAANTVAAMRAVGVGALAWVKALGPGAACALLAGGLLYPSITLLHTYEISHLAAVALCAALSVAAGILAIWAAPRVFLGAGGIALIKAAKLPLPRAMRAIVERL